MGEDLVPGGADKGEGEKDEEMTDGGHGECPGESGGGRDEKRVAGGDE